MKNTVINAQIRSLLEEPDMIAALANVSACIMQNYQDLNWAGFYFVKNNELVLGPFQGKPACTHIPFNKGVCGACYREKKTQRIDDVLSFPGHIACDNASRSELCVPVILDDQCIMEIDLDAPIPSRFTNDEANEMLEAAHDIAHAFSQHHWSA
jgi:GAF domain-containing protein